MSRLVFASLLVCGAFVSGAPMPAAAQGVPLSSCDPATGKTPNGLDCFTLTPTQVSGTNPSSLIGNEGVSRVDPNQVSANVFRCDRSTGGGGGNIGGVGLIENCGTPLQITETMPFFYANTPAPVPPPAPAPIPPAPVAVAPAPPPLQTVTQVITRQIPVAVAAPAPVVAAPVLASSGLGLGLSPALLAAGFGAAAVGGIIAVIASDGDSTVSTVSTN